LILRGGQGGRALPALIAIPKKFPKDSVPAASSLFLRADLAADRGRDDSARALFLAAAAYPTTPFGQRAGLQAGIIAFLDRDYPRARLEFDRIAAEPRHSEGTAALYWSGRTREAQGDTIEARRRYQAVMARGSDGYYAVRASRRLGAPFWSFEEPPNDDRAALPPGLRRAHQLTALGMRVEARFELEGYVAAGASSADRIVATARGLAAGEWHARALRLAQRAQSKGATLDRELAELLYPLPFRDALVAHARPRGAPPALVAGLIRQESAFDPEARSIADARGLMQVLPSVGAQMVRRFAIDWDPVLLYQPDLNLDFGVDHLNDALEKLGWPERALAAYNAGVERVARWRSLRGVDDDPEIFVERIPFVETRDYVRRVLANQAMYQALYGELSR
jgi:soluble lytic murein transglycosylase